MGRSEGFLPVRVCLRPNGPFWGPRGCLKGPRVGQHDILSCIIPKRSVLGSLWPFQGVIWRACQFLPVRDLQRLKISISSYWNFFWWADIPFFFLKYHWLKRAPLVRLGQIWRWCFWEKSTFLHTLFGPKTAIFWPRRAPFDPKPQKHIVTSCFNPKHCIPGLKLVSKQ